LNFLKIEDKLKLHLNGGNKINRKTLASVTSFKIRKIMRNAFKKMFALEKITIEANYNLIQVPLEANRKFA